MIHLSSIPVEDKTNKAPSWQELLSQSKLNTQKLLALVGLENHPLSAESADDLFELRAPQPYLDKIERGNPNDPLLLQILPQLAEHTNPAGFSENPLNEDQFSPVKGLIHKYKNRVLLIASKTCVINCRYCFRRSFPYEEHQQSKEDWLDALKYIKKNKHINEVILSGGDPLSNSNRYLFWLLGEIDSIPHISRIRIHSRLIVSLPQRIDSEFLENIKIIKKPLIIVMHCNHPNELSIELKIAVQQLKLQGVTLLNQSVLLKGINDDAATLINLSEAIFEAGVLPYYLFILDKVTGASHFEVPINKAQELYKIMQATLPGYLVPKLTIEIPGKDAKTTLGHYDQDLPSSLFHKAQ